MVSLPTASADNAIARPKQAGSAVSSTCFLLLTGSGVGCRLRFLPPDLSGQGSALWHRFQADDASQGAVAGSEGHYVGGLVHQ